MNESSSTSIAFTVSPEDGAAYLTIRPHGLVDRQKQIGAGTILDLDDDGNAIGIEVIGGLDLNKVLAQVLTVAKFPEATR